MQGPGSSLDTLLVDGLLRASDGVCVADEAGRIVLWNAAAKEILGYSAAEVHGRVCCAVLQGDGSTLNGYLTDTQDEWSRFALPVRGTDLGVGEAGLWVLSSVDGAVVHVDMGSGRASDPIALTGPLDVAVDHEVWVATSSTTP